MKIVKGGVSENQGGSKVPLIVGYWLHAVSLGASLPFYFSFFSISIFSFLVSTALLLGEL
jgi:hypothetical protein